MSADRRSGPMGDKLTVPYRRAPGAVVGEGSVAGLLRSAPVIGDAAMTVRAAAELMTERRSEYVAIALSGGGFGVLTDADIRARVVATGLSSATPIGQIVDAPARFVGRDTPVIEALTQIVADELITLPVIDADGVLCGVVSPWDFIAGPVGPAMTLRGQIASAATIPDLHNKALRRGALVADLVRRQQPAHEVTAVASLINDAVVRRALELVLATHPDLDPTAFTWLSLGSNGRREPVLSSDVDSAVILDDRVEESGRADYLRAFAEVGQVLTGAGLAIDANGAVASAPMFTRTLTHWQTAAAAWLDAPLDNKGMILTSVLLDGRPIMGQRGLAIRSAVFGDFGAHPGALKMLLAETLAAKARQPAGRGILGRRSDTFDIKTDALIPLVNIARWVALRAGADELSTRARLLAGVDGELLRIEDAHSLIEVFDVLQRIRLNYQVALFDRGETISDELVMHRLSPLDRSLLAQAVREIVGVQRRMGGLSSYLPDAIVGGGH